MNYFMEGKIIKMKIVYFTHYTDLYGANRSLIEIVSNIRNKEVIPIVITPNYGEINKELDVLGILNYSFNYYCWVVPINCGELKRKLLYLRYKFRNYISSIKISSFLRNLNIDIIHSNSSVIDIGAKVAEILKVKHIWHIREFGREDYNLEFFINKKSAVNYILEKSNAVICISKCIENSYFSNIQNEKIKVIYNAVDMLMNSINKNLKKSNKLNIIIARSIIKSKNQLELIRAYSKIDKEIRKNIYIDIVGDGDISYIDNINKIIVSNNFQENIKFLGFIRDIKSIYYKYHIGVVTSLKEGFGRVTVEYMMNNIIPIVSDSGANNEIVNNGVNGFIYKLGDYENIASIITYLYNDHEKIEKILNKAQEDAYEKFNIDRLIFNLVEIYNTI
jgi:glycosyltransferase involved in cell wall biosynthesis